MLIRADASIEIGTGHVMRCLALAQAWQDMGGTVTFVLGKSTPAILERLAKEGVEVVHIDAAIGSANDAESTLEICRSREVRWFVLDGYDFDSAFQERMRSSGARVLVIDDTGACAFYSADLVLNQNFGASEKWYGARAPRTRLLLGPQFALLRREFNKWIGFEREISPSARKLLVSMGGSDPSGLTCRIAREGGFPGLRTSFLFGGSTRQDRGSPDSSTTSCFKDRADIASLLAESDITVICAGGTLWESLFMGCSTLCYTRNAAQEEILKQLQDVGAVEWLGEADCFDRRALATAVATVSSSMLRRKTMLKAGRKIVDGQGANRVLGALLENLCDKPEFIDVALNHV